jgi:hypothetical protein
MANKVDKEKRKQIRNYLRKKALEEFGYSCKHSFHHCDVM